MEIYHYIENKGKIFILKYTVIETPKMYTITNTEVVKGGMNNAMLISRYGKGRIFKSSLYSIMGETGRLSFYAIENSQDNFNDFVNICVQEYKELQQQKEDELTLIKSNIKKLEGEIVK